MELITDTQIPMSLEQVRARVKARTSMGVDMSRCKPFHHEGLGGTLFYGTLPTYAMSRYENIEQFYPLDHPDAALRGQRASTPDLDQRNREKTLLGAGVYTSDGQRLDEAMLEWLLNDPASGPANRRLSLLVLHASFENQSPSQADLITGFSLWDAAFHDLLVKTGWVKHWVEYVTSSDDSTPEAKDAALKLTKLEAAAEEWSKKLQAQQIAEELTAELLREARAEPGAKEG